VLVGFSSVLVMLVIHEFSLLSSEAYYPGVSYPTPGG
jgi:hypothetical protein